MEHIPCKICQLININSTNILEYLKQNLDSVSDPQNICSTKYTTIDISNFILKLYNSNKPISNEISEVIINLFENQHSISFLPSLLTILSFSRDKEETEFARKLLKSCLKGVYLETAACSAIQIFDNFELGVELGTDWEMLVTNLVSLPSRLSNYCFYDFISTKKYSNRLTELVKNMVEKVYKIAIPYKCIPRIAYFLQRLILTGYGFNLVVDIKMNILLDDTWLQIYRSIFHSIDRCHHKIITFQCITHLSSTIAIKLFSTDPIFAKTITETLIFDNSFEDLHFGVKLSKIVVKSSPSLIIVNLIQSLHDSSIYSYNKFKYLILILLKLIISATECQEFGQKYLDLIPHLLNLTDFNKLNLSKYFVQKSTFKLFPQPHQTLKMEIEKSNEITEFDAILEETTDRPTNNYSCSDSEVDSDDITTFNDENEYLDAILIPKYLRDCLTGLQSKQEAKKIEACLRGCCRLIHTRPSELCLLSEELTSYVLYHLRDFELPHMIELKTNVLIDLSVYDTIRTVPYLTNHFCKEFTSTEQISILKVLTIAAERLTHLQNELPHLQLPFITTSNTNKICIKSKNKQIKDGVNIFHKYYAIFIFPLIGILNNCSSHYLEPVVVAQLIHSLSIFLTLTQNSINIVDVILRLIHLVDVILYHPDTIVTKATLLIVVNLFNCMSNLPAESFNYLWRECGDIFTWIKKLKSTSGEEYTRKICNDLYNILIDKM